MKEHDPHDLNRFDPVMVLIEYIRIDNLRLIDLFQFFDTHNRGMLSRGDIRDGVAVRLPIDSWMTCGFTAILAVFQSYRANGRVIKKGLCATRPRLCLYS